MPSHSFCQWRSKGGLGGLQPPPKYLSDGLIFAKNSQFFAPVAPICSTGEYFKKIIISSKKSFRKKNRKFFVRAFGALNYPTRKFILAPFGVSLPENFSLVAPLWFSPPWNFFWISPRLLPSHITDALYWFVLGYCVFFYSLNYWMYPILIFFG